MSSPSPSRIGIIGCGNIAKAYFRSCALFPNLQLVACADIDIERARAAAREYGIPEALSVDDLLTHPDISIAINLTIPRAHAAIDCQALRAGKHVFSEKPFALNLAEGQEIVATAREAGRRIGCAPDTVLGAAIQTARKLLDEGAIGRPVAFAASMHCPGHEHWHPSPEFYYQPGGGPLFDMGPYYLHALITLLGPVRQVSCMAKASFAERVISSQPQQGKRIPVEVPTHVTCLLEFHQGSTGILTTSFDMRGPSTNPVLEIYGEQGSLSVPDPNHTGGTVQLGVTDRSTWQDMPLTHPYANGSRGLGVADLAAAISTGRDHRANERIALHALEIMEAAHVSAREGRHITLSTTCERPAPMTPGLPDYTLD